MNTNNKFKSPQFIMVVFIIAVIVVLVAAMITPSFDSAIKNGVALPFNDGWYSVDDEGTKTPFTSFGQSLNQNEIVLYHDHDDDLNQINALGLYNYYSAVEVYAGNRLIYSYGSMDDIENHIGLGNYYSIIDIHRHEMDQSAVKVVFKNNHPQTIYGFTGGKGGALEMALVREYVFTLLTPLLSVIFLVVTLFLKARKTTRDIITPTHRWLLIFALTISVWELVDSQILMDMGFSAGGVCLTSFELYMLLPIPLLIFTYYSCRKLREYTWTICLLVFANFLVLNILNFTHTVEFLYSLTSSHITIFIALAFCLSQIILEVKSKPDLSNKVLLGGYIAFALGAVVQYLWFFVDPTGSNTKSLQVGLLIFLILQFGMIIYYVTQRTNHIVNRLEEQTAFLKSKFKSFVPDNIIQQRLEKEEGMSKTGEMRYLTVLESDIRGFSQLIQDMTAEDAIDMLNHYLESMTAIITRQGGMCLEFVGDAILALFDEERVGAKHSDKAVMVAVQMQYIMKDINEWNQKHGYPTFEMGIGIHSGDVYVGYIGSEDRMEYDAIGSPMNLVSRIESYSTGGQILVSSECRKNISLDLIVKNVFQIHPKGYHGNIEVYQVVGIGEPYNIYSSTIEEPTHAINPGISLTYSMIREKEVGEIIYLGDITEVSRTNIMLVTQHALELYDNVKFNYDNDFTCKVISKSERGVLLRFTSPPPDFALNSNDNER